MRRLPLALLGAALLLSGCFGSKKIEPFEIDAMRLGVVTPFAYLSSNKSYADIADPTADHISRALFATKRLRVIDRQRLKTTLIELKLPTDGTPLDSAQLAKVCLQLKAEVAVYGSIASVQKDERRKGKRTISSLKVEVEAKLVLSRTAEILSTARAVGSAQVSYRGDRRPPSDVLVNAALDDAAKQIAYQLVFELEPK